MGGPPAIPVSVRLVLLVAPTAMRVTFRLSPTASRKSEGPGTRAGQGISCQCIGLILGLRAQSIEFREGKHHRTSQAPVNKES